MKFLEENFKIIMLVSQALTLLVVLSIKMSTCTLSNDMRTTKKNTKSLNENALTQEQLDQKLQQQKQEYLLQEKQLDNVKDTASINKILNQKEKTKR